jgi:hypothetical protein
MKKIKLLAFLAFFSFSTMIGKEIDSIKINNLQNRVTQLENYKINIENVYKAEFQKTHNELVKQIDDDYGNVKNLFTMILIIGVPSSLCGIYMMFLGINKKVNKTINEKIETIVEQKREDLIKLIKSKEFER